MTVSTAACVVCLSDLWQDEAGRLACRRCTDRISDDLAALPGLYSQLGGALMPGSGAGGPAVSGSRTAPLPLRLAPLSLAARGGVVTVLQTWLVDWHEALGYRHPRWEGDLIGQCRQAVARLQLLLPWAAEEHPAIDEFAAEVRQLRRQCVAQVTGERPVRTVAVACPCGATLRITLDTLGRRCVCGEQYGREALLGLPLAERRQVAA
ncbi:hypothetical protein [Streptomyces albidoflavus]|uniref:hypothetical protein n=1 Tax=Streptomyces albidoflavus TaxID=1886 RepID=UPI00102110B9|nr:hypothetical protein [Streptomyces albidoflavus]RZF06001.1 hypothetical protein C0R05_24520 [Streptomyces albidoflavus]